MVSDIRLPTASCPDQPKILSASAFHPAILPAGFIVTTASSAVSRIERIRLLALLELPEKFLSLLLPGVHSGHPLAHLVNLPSR